MYVYMKIMLQHCVFSYVVAYLKIWISQSNRNSCSLFFSYSKIQIALFVNHWQVVEDLQYITSSVIIQHSLKVTKSQENLSLSRTTFQNTKCLCQFVHQIITVCQASQHLYRILQGGLDPRLQNTHYPVRQGLNLSAGVVFEGLIDSFYGACSRLSLEEVDMQSPLFLEMCGKYSG